MAETTLVTQTPYEESRTISLGSVTDFTIDLSRAQRWVADMTGDGALTVTRPVNQVNQEITLLVRCAAPRVLTLPANSYTAAGALASFTFLPAATVGTGGHVLKGITTVNGIFWVDGSVAAGAIPDAALASKIYKTPGMPGVVSFGFTADDIAEGDTLTLGARVYTFKAVPVDPDLDIDMSGAGAAPWTAAVSITQAVAKINADADREFNVLNMGSDTMGAIETAVTGVAPASAASNASVKVSAATAVGSVSPAVVQRVTGKYAVTANDVTSLALGGGTGEIVIAAFPSTTVPRVHSLSIQTAAGVFKSAATVGTRAAQFNAAYWGLVLADAGAVLIATDVVTYEIEL